MYIKPGLVVVPDGKVIPSKAGQLLKALPPSKFESEIHTCIEKLGTDKTWLTGLLLQDLNKMNSPAIEPGSILQQAVILITHRLLKSANFLTEDIPVISYTNEPVLTVDEAIDRMLTPTLPYPTAEDMNGDKGNLLTLKTFLPITIEKLAFQVNLKPQIFARLRAHLGNIGFKIFMNQPIDQAEKTFFMLCADTSEGKPGAKLALTSDGTATPIPAVESSDPLNAKYFEELKKVVEPGPGLRFRSFISNQSLTNLLFFHGPMPKSLTTTVGYMYQRGPFTELHLSPLDQRAVTAQDQMAGIRDLVRELGIVTPPASAGAEPTKTSPFVRYKGRTLSWQLSAPSLICGPAGGCVPFSIDLPQINLRLTSQDDCANHSWYYYSRLQQRTLSSLSGATADDVYVDLAVHEPQLGEAAVSELSLESLDVAILENSVLARKVELAQERIFEEIHFVRGAGLETKLVDMTEYYSQLGIVQFRPTFGEYVFPPRAWLMAPDNNAVEYITSRLGLSKMNALRSGPALVMSHNAAVIQRLTGSPVPYDLKALLRALLETVYVQT
jgi:hypothetical protein